MDHPDARITDQKELLKPGPINYSNILLLTLAHGIGTQTTGTNIPQYTMYSQ